MTELPANPTRESQGLRDAQSEDLCTNPRLARAEPDWPRRAIVLGASNVAIGFPAVVASAAARWGRPLDLLAACGHGRSYGLTTRVLGRGLPSISDCALWERLRERPSAPTAALLTDVGNDLLYQAPVATILAWVESCLRRLRECDARVIVTGLPLCNLANPSPRRFLFFRTLFFPGCSLPLEQLIDSARRLDDGLASLTERYQAVRVEPQAAWYGLDPIHLRYLQADHLWPEILASWTARETSTVDGQSLRFNMIQRWRLHRLAPASWTWQGRPRQVPQPAAALPEGVRLWLY